MPYLPIYKLINNKSKHIVVHTDRSKSVSS